ncbi:hypothetical protein [Thermogemmatispora sp.]|uniref:hypothetical protein n=1 Tax=Thermogemmatispora sp. TaxID=1968838 RepID=UPI0035E41A85
MKPRSSTKIPPSSLLLPGLDGQIGRAVAQSAIFRPGLADSGDRAGWASRTERDSVSENSPAATKKRYRPPRARTTTLVGSVARGATFIPFFLPSFQYPPFSALKRIDALVGWRGGWQPQSNPSFGLLTGATANAHRVGSQGNSLMPGAALHHPRLSEAQVHEVLVLFFAFAHL